MVDLHAAEIDQLGALVLRLAELAHGIPEVRGEYRLAVDIERIRVKNAFPPGLTQAYRIQNAERNAVRAAARAISRSQAPFALAPVVTLQIDSAAIPIDDSSLLIVISLRGFRALFMPLPVVACLTLRITGPPFGGAVTVLRSAI